MIVLYIGLVEITQGTAIDRQVTQTARAMGDLASQANQSTNYDISSTQLANILAAATAMMYPNSTSSLQVTITGINIAANGTATVLWSGANAKRYGIDQGSDVDGAKRPKHCQYSIAADLGEGHIPLHAQSRLRHYGNGESY